MTAWHLIMQIDHADTCSDTRVQRTYQIMPRDSCPVGKHDGGHQVHGCCFRETRKLAGEMQPQARYDGLSHMR